MARRTRIFFSLPKVEEDTRPHGSLMFADPSKAEFPRHIHTFNEPQSTTAKGEQNGIRSIDAWDRRQNDTELHRRMGLKRGTINDGEKGGS